MAKEAFTPHFIKSVTCPPGKKSVLHTDRHTMGLRLEVRKSGGKTYYAYYRDEYGAQRKIKIDDATSITLQAARNAVVKIRSRIAEGEDPLKKKQAKRTVPKLDTFFKDRYLPFIKNSKRSWETDLPLYKHHVSPHIGGMRADAIEQSHIYEFYHGMRNKGYAVNTCNRVFALVRRMFNLMIKWGLLERLHSPTKGMDKFQEVLSKERFLNREEINALFAAMKQSSNPQLYFVVAFLLLTGARRTEALRASWDSFDFATGFWRIPFTKSGKPRQIPLSDELMRLLNKLPSRGVSPWLFPNPDTGAPYHDLYTAWNKARKQAGLADLRMHDLRHSFASFLVNSGRSIYEVQKLLGHSDIKITERYAHLADSTLRNAVNSAGQFVQVDVEATQVASATPKRILTPPSFRS